MRLQRPDPQPLIVKNRNELDHALLTAVEHTEEKQRELVEEGPESPRAEALASDLVHRVEDVDILAADARVATEQEVATDGGRPADASDAADDQV